MNPDTSDGRILNHVLAVPTFLLIEDKVACAYT